MSKQKRNPYLCITNSVGTKIKFDNKQQVGIFACNLIGHLISVHGVDELKRMATDWGTTDILRIGDDVNAVLQFEEKYPMIFSGDVK